MTSSFQFGLVIRGQAEHGEDISRRLQETLAMVRLADRLGYDSVTKTAHYSAHPFQMLQMVPMLARFTAEAPRLRLNAGVLLLPLYSPLHVAEEFATLDVLSGGKIILGVGLGYRDVEFKAFGMPRQQRARRFEANLIAIRRLWSEDKVSMRTPYFELDDASCLPKPLQRPHPPIWIGANADPAVSARHVWATAGISVREWNAPPSNVRWNFTGGHSTPPANRFRRSCRCAAKCSWRARGPTPFVSARPILAQSTRRIMRGVRNCRPTTADLTRSSRA